MRVIAGEFRSRKLKPVPGDDVRPTPDRLREALFNVLAPQIEGTTFVDAYAGTGAVGIEALSRGAKRAVFLEKSPAALAILRENLESLGLVDRAAVIRGAAVAGLRGLQADIVFLDPPYARPDEYESCLEWLGSYPQPLVIAQHATRHVLKDRYGRLERFRILKQGDNSLSFFHAQAEGDAG